MKRIRFTKKGFFYLLLILVFMAVSFYSGGVLGYLQGYESAKYFRDSDAYSTTLVLEKMRSGDLEAAINMLETRLDQEIVLCGTTEDAYRSPFNIFWFVFGRVPGSTHRILLTAVAEYRKKYPSSSIFPEVRQQITEILSEGSKK